MSTPIVPTHAQQALRAQLAAHGHGQLAVQAQLAAHGQLASSAHHAGSSSLSAGAIVALVAAGLVILACLAWAAARWWAYEPHWLPSARHACAEAGLRLSATWGELRDWMRLGH